MYPDRTLTTQEVQESGFAKALAIFRDASYLTRSEEDVQAYADDLKADPSRLLEALRGSYDSIPLVCRLVTAGKQNALDLMVPESERVQVRKEDLYELVRDPKKLSAALKRKSKGGIPDVFRYVDVNGHNLADYLSDAYCTAHQLAAYASDVSLLKRELESSYRSPYPPILAFVDAKGRNLLHHLADLPSTQLVGPYLGMMVGGSPLPLRFQAALLKADHRGETPVHIAARNAVDGWSRLHRFERYLDAAIQAGFDFESTDAEGNTLAHCALMRPEALSDTRAFSETELTHNFSILQKHAGMSSEEFQEFLGRENRRGHSPKTEADRSDLQTVSRHLARCGSRSHASGQTVRIHQTPDALTDMQTVMVSRNMPPPKTKVAPQHRAMGLAGFQRQHTKVICQTLAAAYRSSAGTQEIGKSRLREEKDIGAFGAIVDTQQAVLPFTGPTPSVFWQMSDVRSAAMQTSMVTFNRFLEESAQKAATLPTAPGELPDIAIIASVIRAVDTMLTYAMDHPTPEPAWYMQAAAALYVIGSWISAFFGSIKDSIKSCGKTKEAPLEPSKSSSSPEWVQEVRRGMSEAEYVESLRTTRDALYSRIERNPKTKYIDHHTLPTDTAPGGKKS